MSIILFYISRPAGSNFIYPTEDEEPPPLMEDGAEGGESIVPFGHTHESIDALHRRYMEAVAEDAAEGEPVEEKEAPSSLVIEPSEEKEAPPALVAEPAEDLEYGRYISNMVSRWAGSDYESSPDEYAHCSSGCSRGH